MFQVLKKKNVNSLSSKKPQTFELKCLLVCVFALMYRVSQNTWGQATDNNSTNDNIGCLNIHGTHVTTNNVLFFVSDLKIVYYNKY